MGPVQGLGARAVVQGSTCRVCLPGAGAIIWGREGACSSLYPVILALLLRRDCPCYRPSYSCYACFLQLQDLKKNEDPRLSFSTPEFKEAQRIFTDNFKVNQISGLMLPLVVMVYLNTALACCFASASGCCCCFHLLKATVTCAGSPQ